MGALNNTPQKRVDDLPGTREDLQNVAGRILAHDSPAALKQRTGADTMDAAFLRLIRDDAGAAA